MYIILIDAYENGSRPAMQNIPDDSEVPAGYAVCPDEFVSVFYSTDPAGFVNITVDGGTVTDMSVNQDALDAYIAEHPEDPEPVDPQPDPIEELRSKCSELESQNKLLTEQVEALSGQLDFQEECIVEMAGIVYA